MRIVLNGVPPSLNQFLGREPHAYRDAKEQWTTLAFLKAKTAKDKPATPYKHAAVRVTYYFPDNRRHDADNYCGKLFMDGLTKAGIIADDDFKHISTHYVGKVDKSYPRTVIEVEEEENEDT